jgi:MscS family membrane protein
MFEFETRHPRFSLSLLVAVFILLCFSATSLGAQETAGEDDLSIPSKTPEQLEGGVQFRAVRTDSPRQTLTSLLRLRDELEQTLLTANREGRTFANHERVLLLGEQTRALLDLSSVPSRSRRKIGRETMALLLDILGRIELPDLESVPDVDAFADDAAPASWRIPSSCSVRRRFGLHRGFIGALKACLFDHPWGSRAGVVLFPSWPDR